MDRERGWTARATRVTLLCGIAVLGGLLLSGCGFNGHQSTLAPLGPVAERQKQVFMVTVWVTLGIFATVGSFLLYCILKFYHKGEITPDTPLPEQGHGDALTEIALILVSVALVGVIAVPTLKGIFYMWTVPKNENVLTIHVYAHQWWWEFEYPKQDLETANEFAIPAGRPVKFILTSRDVIHSFWLPRLGGKMDVIPGQTNVFWLQADPRAEGRLNHTTWRVEDGGVLYGQCAEFCGESHAFMLFRALVLNSHDFHDWMKHEKAAAVISPQVKAGYKVFMANRCSICHTIRGGNAYGEVGPDLTHVGSRLLVGGLTNTPAHLREWLSDPNAVKPGDLMWKAGYKAFKIHLTHKDVDNLASFLTSLK